MGHSSDVCKYSFHTVLTYPLPAQTIVIPNSAQVGDYIGGAQTNDRAGFGGVNGGYDTFFICAPWSAVLYNSSAGTEDYLWVTGTRPSGVYLSPDTPTAVDGEPVWTTNALSNVGMGFTLRWRAQASGSGVGRGAWRSPGAGWNVDVPPSADGFPFYQATFIEDWQGCSNYFNAPDYPGLSAFRNAMTCLTGVGIPYYGAQVEVRHVLTKPWSGIVTNSQDVTNYVTTDLVILKGRAASHSFTGQATVRNTVRFLLPPSTACTTPTVEEGTVYVGTVYPNSFPNAQWSAAAYRDFTLTFRNCPRINLKYYVHANGNRWVDSSRGVVGVQDSVPGAPNSIAGNPSGFAVQLQHRSGGHQHTGNVYVHPNEVAQPLSLPDTGQNVQAYTRTWNGAGTVNVPNVGVTHTIPLRARLVRTAHSSQQQIKVGPFNTSVIVAISYP